MHGTIMGSKWINKYFDKLQFIIPHKRLNFSKNGKMGAGSWFDTCFYCYGLNLKKDIIKLQFKIHTFLIQNYTAPFS